jgi:hypothetical protein
VRASLNTSQQRKECLGIAKENQTNLHQSTFGSFFLRLSQVAAHEYLPLLDFQRGKSKTPNVISGSQLWMATKSSDLTPYQNQSLFFYNRRKSSILRKPGIIFSLLFLSRFPSVFLSLFPYLSWFFLGAKQK